MSAKTIALLDCLSAARQRGEDPVAALRGSGLSNANRVAERLAGGANLLEALGDLVHNDVSSLLDPQAMCLQQALDVMREELQWRQQRNIILIESLSYPVSLLFLFSALLLYLGYSGWLQTQMVWLWWALPAFILTALVPLLPWCLPRLSIVLPGLFGWRMHLALSRRYRRAALVARWHLPEADAKPLLGENLAGLGPILEQADADRYCQNLATYHQSAATRALRRTLRWLCGSWYIAVGLVALGIYIGLQEKYIELFNNL